MARERKGCVIDRADGFYARLRYIDEETGRERSREWKAANKTAARKLIRKQIETIAKKGSKAISRDGATFNQLAAEYEKRKLIPAEYRTIGGKTQRVAGLRSVQSPLRWIKTLRAHFGRRPVKSITAGQIEDFKLMRLGTPAAIGKTGEVKERALASVNRELELMRAIFRYGVREQYLDVSPFANGSNLIVKAENERDRILSHEEEVKLLSACFSERSIPYIRGGHEVVATYKNGRPRLEALIVTALDTAMRRGELLKLVWSDVSFPARTITIRATNSKTLKRRVVGMSSRVYERLKTLSSGRPDELVFGILDTFKKSWANVCDESGIEGLRFHDLRHTAITRMVESGVPHAEIMKISGHSQQATFLRYLNPPAERVVNIASQVEAFNARQHELIAEKSGSDKYVN